MYFSINRFTGDGTTTQWEFNFSGGYIDQSHVKVLVTDTLGNETVPAYTWVGPNTISIVPAVDAGYELEVYRDTPKNLPLVDYTDGAIVSEKNLDTTAEQTVFATAEVFDRFADVAALSEIAVADSAEALALATSASNAVQQALTDSADAVAAVAGAVTAANNATAAAGAATIAANAANQTVTNVTTTANSALAIATDAEAVATGIAATADQALLDSAEALSTATGIAATADAAFVAANAATATANSAESLATTASSDAESAVAALSFKVDKDSATGAASMPVGSTAQRPAGASGKFRYNSTVGQFEGHNGSAWHRHYTQNNVIGTVSQSGGIPTGAVIERGSNANGQYVRFANGTQICWQVHTNPSWTGANNTSATWTFPAVFIVAPVVNPTILTGFPNQFNAAVSGQTTTSAPIFTGGTTSSGGVAITYVTATGLWF